MRRENTSNAKHVSITPERNNSIIRKIKRFLHYRAFQTTLVTMLRVPITDLYHPAPRYAKNDNFYPAVPHRYRGLLALSLAACTGCRKCERICPNNTIIMEVREINGKEYRFPGYFAGRCMYCGLCEEVCDRQFAIRHTDQWEDAAYGREQLYYGTERMFDMWNKHIEPKIQANMTHRAVPDKRRWSEDTIHDLEALKNPPPTKIPEEFQQRVKENAKDPEKQIPFNIRRND